MPDSSYSQELPPDIQQGTTGVPVIDEAVRSLHESGTLHNHARMWLASYVVHMRHVHWRAGADWLVAHLLDGDLASNHLSWQWIAGTGSHKPYLFNADNVERFAPTQWHSPGSVVDQSYEALDDLAHGRRPMPAARQLSATLTPKDTASSVANPVLTTPPEGLQVGTAASIHQDQIRGREVWLVHPWALRAPPADVPTDAVVMGVYLQQFHAAWPWSETRWRWVDTAMREVTTQRYFIDAADLAACLGGAVRVRSVSDPHITRWLEPFAQLDPEPALFPGVDRRCQSFSQWWTRATRGSRQAGELL